MSDSYVFKALRQTHLNMQLPVQWVEAEQITTECSYFLLTDLDLFFISPLGELSAKSLISKKNPALLEALKRRSVLPKTVLDATCGFSGDTSILLDASVAVQGFESNAFALVFLAYFRQKYQQRYEQFQLFDSCFSDHNIEHVECLYLDPMFDDSRKRLSRLSMNLLGQYQEHSPAIALSLLKEGLKKIRFSTLVVKSSKRQPPLLKGFVSSTLTSKSVTYWRFYTNDEVIKDENFNIS